MRCSWSLICHYVKDLIRELLQSLVEVMGQLDERLHRPGKVPIKSPRLQGERPATTVPDIKNRDAAWSFVTTIVFRLLRPLLSKTPPIPARYAQTAEAPPSGLSDRPSRSCRAVPSAGRGSPPSA